MLLNSVNICSAVWVFDPQRAGAYASSTGGKGISAIGIEISF